MAYHCKKTLFHTSFDAFVEDLTINLYKEGFMILASSDIRKIFKDNLQVTMKERNHLFPWPLEATWRIKQHAL